MGIWVIIFICHIWDMGCLNPLGVLSIIDSECIPGDCEVEDGAFVGSVSPRGRYGVGKWSCRESKTIAKQ